jgi:hypothetical protein
MFKRIPGNLDYRIDLNGNVVDIFGHAVKFKKKPNGSIDIDLFSSEREVSLKHLALLAWYQVGCMNNLRDHITKIRFKPINSRVLKVRCQNVMVFSEPAVYKEGFRYIPCFPRYAINLDGVIIDTLTSVSIEKFVDDRDNYEKAYIFNPDKESNRWTSVHRLMALAWLPNDDFLNRPYINHINGCRSDNHLTNLEWCSQQENNHHAVSMGLVTTSVKMKTRDVVSGEIAVYMSAAEMSAKLGTSSVAATAYVNKLPGYLFKGRYEIKLFDDNEPWHYESEDSVFNANNPRKAIFSITTLDKTTGEEKNFINLKVFRKEYGIWTPSVNIEDSVVKFREKYPNHEIKYKRNAVSGPYRVMDIVNGVTFILDNMADAATHMGRGRCEIQYDLSRGLKFIYDQKWLVVAGTGEYDIRDFKNKTNQVIRSKV